jgi:peroxiredoxin
MKLADQHSGMLWGMIPRKGGTNFMLILETLLILKKGTEVRVRPAWLVAVCIGLIVTSLSAAERTFHYQPLSPELIAVPQTLLPLIHAAEVQEELGLKGAKWESFLPRLQVIDGLWWRARILPPLEHRRVTSQQERTFTQQLQETFGEATLQRLRQLELQSQGYRMLLRADVADFLELTKTQQSQLTELFAATDSAGRKAAAASSGDAEPLQQLWLQSKTAEPQKAHSLLTPDQQQGMGKLIGKLLNTSNLQRIYPLAPELIDSGAWTIPPGVTLARLRGQVVVIHFYAFQCHNCQANFKIYNRWQKQFAGKGVQVIGIQTPETVAERDPAQVVVAALQDEFQFPVLIDVESKNWQAWSNTMWPTVYVIDKRGYIRFWWQGELNWKGATTDQQIESVIDRLLSESE